MRGRVVIGYTARRVGVSRVTWHALLVEEPPQVSDDGLVTACGLGGSLDALELPLGARLCGSCRRAAARLVRA